MKVLEPEKKYDFWFKNGHVIDPKRGIDKVCDVLVKGSKIVEAPENIELAMRKKDGKRWLFALNYNPFMVDIHLKKPLVSMLSGNENKGVFTLPAYSAEVWRTE